MYNFIIIVNVINYNINKLTLYLFIYKVSEEMIPINDFPTLAYSVLWELWPSEKRVFIACSDNSCLTFVYVRDSING